MWLLGSRLALCALEDVHRPAVRSADEPPREAYDRIDAQPVVRRARERTLKLTALEEQELTTVGAEHEALGGDPRVGAVPLRHLRRRASGAFAERARQRLEALLGEAQQPAVRLSGSADESGIVRIEGDLARGGGGGGGGGDMAKCDT